jgi:haloalkane dehalogenase
MDSFDNGNAAAQALHYRTLLAADCPSYFIWGCSDNVFTEAWGRTWAERMGASFDPIPAAGHFLQNTHGPEVADLLLKRIAAESA